jgi:hypothetical protein
MNHHADKVVYASSGEADLPSAPTIDGLLEEFHACPACGSAASRFSAASK